MIFPRNIEIANVVGSEDEIVFVFDKGMGPPVDPGAAVDLMVDLLYGDSRISNVRRRMLLLRRYWRVFTWR